MSETEDGSLVPFRTPPKSSILRDVKDPLEEILEEEEELGGSRIDVMVQSYAADIKPDEVDDVMAVRERATAALAKLSKSDKAKRKGKRKRKPGAKAKKSSSDKFVGASYCEDWSKVNWQPGPKLGAGAFGVVYTGLREDGAIFAVKQIVLRADDNAVCLPPPLYERHAALCVVVG
jgi:hypothetical protein